MHSFSIWHGLLLLIYLLVIGYPIARILRRLGYSPWWTIVAFAPLVNLVGLWFLSFARWPREM